MEIAVLSSVDSLLDPEGLREVLGLAEPPRLEALETLGYSGSRFWRVHVGESGRDPDTFVVKRTSLAGDWFSVRTDDRVGREAAVLREPRLREIHEIFRLPHRAVASEPGRVAVLMEDVSDGLFPDARQPMDREEEDLILDTLARLHAAFWASPELDELSWLHDPADFLYLMGPRDHDDGAGRGSSARDVQVAIREGWDAALGLLADPVREAVRSPPGEIASAWSDLPVTLVHGDTKIANFAVLPDGRLSVFDWAFAGRAPCTFDLGWYLAVNASRLAGSKEETLARYRGFLEAHLGSRLVDDLWAALEEAGIVCGALMLLWSKGAAVASGRPGAGAEWAWWEDRLRRWADRSRPHG